MIQPLGFCFLGRVSVQRPPCGGAPSPFLPGLPPPVSCLQPHLVWSRTPLALLVWISLCITSLVVLRGPLPSQRGMEQSTWVVKCFAQLSPDTGEAGHLYVCIASVYNNQIWGRDDSLRTTLRSAFTQIGRSNLWT